MLRNIYILLSAESFRDFRTNFENALIFSYVIVVNRFYVLQVWCLQDEPWNFSFNLKRKPIVILGTPRE